MNHDRDTHDNAARLVIEILRVSREVSESERPTGEDPILNTLESPETVELLLKIIFGRNVSILSSKAKQKVSIVNQMLQKQLFFNRTTKKTLSFLQTL